MNPDDLIEAAPAIAKGAGALAAAIPFTAIVKRMLGPAADEIAEMWRDQVRVYRYGRQLKLLDKAERMAADAGFTPQPVPPKILFPLLEGASFEENEDLHDMWAALLANASSPDSSEIRPGFIATLKQLSRDEAQLLNWTFDFASSKDELDVPIDFSEFAQAYSQLGFPIETEWTLGPVRCPPTSKGREVYSCLYGLQAAGLVLHRDDLVGIDYFSLTARGYQFVAACRPPKPKT